MVESLEPNVLSNSNLAHINVCIFSFVKGLCWATMDQICSLKKRDQHLKSTKHANTRASCVSLLCMTSTPKKAEDFFQQQMPSHCLESLLLWQILYRNENRSLHHLTFDHPKKIPGVGSIWWNVSDPSSPHKYGWTSPKYLHEWSRKWKHQFHPPLCFWQCTILYSRKKLSSWCFQFIWKICASQIGSWNPKVFAFWTYFFKPPSFSWIFWGVWPGIGKARKAWGPSHLQIERIQVQTSTGWVVQSVGFHGGFHPHGFPSLGGVLGCWWFSTPFFGGNTVDASGNPKANHRLHGANHLVNNGITYLSLNWLVGFLLCMR